MRPGLWQIILVIVLIFILFGSSKIPDMMRNLAGGINVFKKELKDDKKEEGDIKSAAAHKKSAVKKAFAKKSVARKTPVKKAAAKKPAVKKTAKK